jgi:hypothetical protein
MERPSDSTVGRDEDFLVRLRRGDTVFGTFVKTPNHS